MHARTILAALLALALGVPAIGQQEETFDDEVRTLLNDGLDLYKRGRYEESYAKFEQAFQRKPSSGLVYSFLDMVGMDVVASMMNAPDENIRNTGQRLFALAQPGSPIREGKAKVLEYIDDLDSDEFAVSANARFHLKNYGAWCVRFLIPHLADAQADRMRGKVIELLTSMGRDVTLALVEALDSNNAFLRQQAALVLGNIKDDRALPALKRLYEDPNQPPEVKTLVHEAIQKTTRLTDAAQWRKAADYYYELASNFYSGHSAVLPAWERYYLLWKWDPEGDRLTERRVARFAYNEQLAEEALFDLLQMNAEYIHGPTGSSAWSLLAMTHFQQALEARAGVEAGLQALANDEITPEQFFRLVREMEGSSEADVAGVVGAIQAAGSYDERQQAILTYLERDARVTRARVLARIPGAAVLYEALYRSLDDRNYPVAEACIEALAVMGKPDDLPSPPGRGTANGVGTADGVGMAIGMPLIDALGHEDKRVRYAAARAMVALNPRQPKFGMELVVPSLVDALGEQSVRVALVIYDVQSEEDINFINQFKRALVRLNVFPVIARSGREGMVKAKAFPSEDVIIVQKKIAPQIYFHEDHIRRPIVETVFDTLRDDVRTRNIPRVLLCRDEAERSAARQQYDLTAQGYILPETHELDLKNLLEQLFSTPEAEKDAKERADAIARDAAEALASIDPTNTIYPFRDSVEVLVRTVSPTERRRLDSIRIPAARALGNFGDTRGIDALSAVLDLDAHTFLSDEQRAQLKPLRHQCAKSLREIFRQTRATPDEEVHGVLKRYTKDGDIDIEVVVGEALGNASLTPAQRLDLERFRRIERETYTADDE